MKRDDENNGYPNSDPDSDPDGENNANANAKMTRVVWTWCGCYRTVIFLPSPRNTNSPQGYWADFSAEWEQEHGLYITLLIGHRVKEWYKGREDWHAKDWSEELLRRRWSVIKLTKLLEKNTTDSLHKDVLK